MLARPSDPGIWPLRNGEAEKAGGLPRKVRLRLDHRC